MKRSKVYFSDLRASTKENLLSKLNRLMDGAGFREILAPRDLVAVKLHFGEKGNTAYIRPVFIRRIVDHIVELGGAPFLTDANTLYVGTRGNSASHIRTAIENGFAYSVVNAPIVIADGIRGASSSDVRIGQELIDTAHIGKEIVEADAFVSVAHFKGHELSGFGGTIKNVGMGCASRKGKLEQHSDLSPKVKAKKCLGCGTCVDHCAQEAITLREEKAFIDTERCVGCSECILVCPEGAIEIQWDTDVVKFQKKMAEYALAVVRGKEKKGFFMNFLTDISPACDCYGHCDAPIVHDIGVLAATDPVAIDQASADLVNLQSATEGTCLSQCKAPGEDKFKALYPNIDWSVQLAHAEEIGLGTRQYELVRI
jgi:uncharacterized Fe-S center protein